MFTKTDADHGANQSSCGPIRFTRFTSTRGDLSKKIALVDGQAKKTLAPPLYKGMFEVLTIDGLAELVPILSALERNQALSFGVPQCALESGHIVADAVPESKRPADAITRTRDAFRWPAGCGILHLDYDAPDEGEPLNRDALLAELYAVLPALRDAPHIYWPSSSSLIFDGDREISGVRGQHVYVAVRDATDIERAGAVLNRRVWLAGHGQIKINACGAKLERGLIDAGVFLPERLCFSAGAICEGSLSQRRGDPMLLGGMVSLDTKEALQSLSTAEEHDYEKLVKGAKRAAEPRAAVIREKCIKEKGGTLAKERGLTVPEAEACVRAAVENQRLQADFELTFVDGVRKTVREVLADRDAFDMQRIRHPLDDEYPDHRIGVLVLKPASGHPYAYVHAGPLKLTLHATLKTIRIQAGAIMDAVEQTIDAVRERGRVFVRGSDLVAVGADARGVPLSHHQWKNELDSTAAFERFAESKVDRTTQVKGTYVPANAEDDLALRVRAHAGLGSLPRLLAVIDHPIVLPSGRVVSKPGYDTESRLFLSRSESRAWPRLGQHVTLDDVHRALRSLWRPFERFDFASDVDRGAMLAALLTAVVRRGLSTAPAFLMAAPTAGSGKSLLASCVSTLAGGAPALVLPSTEDERQKTFFSLLREGAPAMFFDNVEGALTSPNLCALLTTPAEIGYSGRVLGKSETSGALPSNALIVLTGNNLAMRDDLARRTVRVYVDPGVEAPASRVFDFSPLEMVRRDRCELIEAALTILVAWVATPLFAASSGWVGSFEEWDRLVCGAVNWIDREGMTTDAGKRWGDAKASIDDAIAADSGIGEIEALYRGWATGDADEGLLPALGYELSAKAIFDQLERIRSGATPDDAVAGAAARAVHDAGGLFQKPQSLGQWLHRYANKVAGGYVLRDTMTREKKKLWSLERVGVA